jgi:hypothetical protein
MTTPKSGIDSALSHLVGRAYRGKATPVEWRRLERAGLAVKRRQDAGWMLTLAAIDGYAAWLRQHEPSLKRHHEQEAVKP